MPLPADESRFQLFLDALNGNEIVVLDNYFFTTEYQKKIKERGSKLVCIDDMHDKHYFADVVINHALTDPLLFDCEAYTKLCLGFDYALLRAPFLKPVSCNNRYKSIIVCFGGSDFLHIADKVVSMLLSLHVQYNIVVVLGEKAQLSETNSQKVAIKRSLSAYQMAELFEKDQSVIARHISNAFKEGELEEKSNMHFLHNTQYKYRPTKIYDLDTIICVGYRVHSKRGTAFRIWARQIIKDYLVKGYAVNERIRHEQIGELRQLVGMLGRTIQNQEVISNDGCVTVSLSKR